MNGRIELYLHSREMLRSIIQNLSFWIHIFEFGIADVNFPPCIRIKGDIHHQDIDTNRIIDQKFSFNRRNDKPEIPRYLSSDGKYVFKFNDFVEDDFQWFLIEKAATLITAYLKTPAPYVGAVLGRNPLIIPGDKWKIYTNFHWQAVINPINVISCEQLQQQGQQTEESDQASEKSTQSNSAQTSSPTTSPSTIPQSDSPASTVKVTIESMPECIKIKIELQFLEDNNDQRIKIESILKVFSKLAEIFY